jgi:hypothetical protein
MATRSRGSRHDSRLLQVFGRMGSSRWVRIVVPTLLALAGVARTAAAAPTVACGKLLPPAQRVYFGVMPGWAFQPGTRDDIPDPFAVRQFEAYTGRKVAFAPWSVSWHDHLTFPTPDVEALWRAGYVPQIRLDSFPTQAYGENPVPAPGPAPSSSIAAGAHDAELRAFADAARATDIPISFDYDYEMNNAQPWGGRYDGGGTTTGYGDPTWPDGPERFRDAYRRIVTIFREEGATNVTFFFHAGTVNGYQDGGYWPTWERMKYYYPGDDYMDWVGLSVYAEHDFNDVPQSFEQKLAGALQPPYEGGYAEGTALGSRPLSIEEMGLYNMPSEQSKAQWVEDAAAVLESGRYPRIAAVDWLAQNKENGKGYDAYPNTSQTFLNGFKAAFDEPFFDAAAQFSGDCSPLAPTRATLKRRTLAWSAVPNVARYEVWRGRQRVAVTSATSVRVAKPGPYRVRGVNIVGFGPFTTAR